MFWPWNLLIWESVGSKRLNSCQATGTRGTSTAAVSMRITAQNDAPVANDLAGVADEDGGAVNFSADFTDVDTREIRSRVDQHRG